VSLASGAFTLACSTSGNVALTHATSGASFPISTNTALHGGETCTLGVVASKVTDAGGAKPVANTTVAFTVAAAGPTGYYSHVNTSSPSQLRCSLHDTIKGHTAYPYSGGTTNTWTILEIADEDPNNSGRILDAYRNRSYLKVTERAGSGSGLRYNREHTWPNSLGFGSATGNLGLPYAPYTDTHMLYLTDATWNADRGNKPYADCSSGCGERVTEANNGVGGGSGVYPGNSNWVQSPGRQYRFVPGLGQAQGRHGARGAVHGDPLRRRRGSEHRAIRARPGTHQRPQQDRHHVRVAGVHGPALDAAGLARGRSAGRRRARPQRSHLQSFQGNRNPFIDHPEWATNALFTSTKPATCQLN
jgi:endonuclease I